MERLRRFLLSMSLIFASTALYAQTEISGTVLDDFGEGVIGATVMEKGTSNGTVTDFEGNFKIKVKAGAVLAISYIGYQTQEVPAAMGMKVELVPDDKVLQEVVVTGSRHATAVSRLPMNVTVVTREQLTENHQQSILPTLSQEVPGLFINSRGVMGYGVSGGGSGSLNLRGLSGGSRVLVLIDGHPQYANIFDHPIGDAYQTMMAERVEVASGPASVLYGSNAMGGVINIVTRKMHEDGVRTSVNVGAGSYGSVQTEVSNQVRQGRFSSTVAAQYSRSDNHRPHMGFEQYGGYLKLGYDFNEHWNAYVDANITHFNASYPGTEDKSM